MAWKGNYSHLNSTPNWFKKLYLNAQKEIWNQDKIKNTYRTLSEDETRALVCLTSLLVMLETGKEKEHQELNLNCPSICSVDKEYSEKVNDYLENYFGFSLIEWSRKENEKND